MVSVLHGNQLPVYTGTVKFTNYPFNEIGWTKVLILLVNRKNVLKIQCLQSTAMKNVII